MIKPDADLFAAYESINETMMRPEFQNREGYMTRFTDVPSVLLVNTDLAGEGKIEGYEDLLNPRLHGKIAMADPALSSSSYEQMAALCSGRQCPPSPAAGQWDTAAPGRW